MFKKFDNINSNDAIKWLKRVAFSLGIFLVLGIIISIFYGELIKVINLISALAILISALLASYSVMRNIENTNNNEKIKKEEDKKANIVFFIQNLNDLLSVIKQYKNIDIGDMKINTINTLYYIFERKLSNIEDKNIQNILLDEELNLFMLIRLRLYESIGSLINFKQCIISENPKNFNENTIFLTEKLQTLIELISKNHKITMLELKKK